MCGQVPVQTEEELVELMQEGIANRTIAATSMNAASSRSHCLVILMVEKHMPDGSVCHGKLCLVDLAGDWTVCITYASHTPCSLYLAACPPTGTFHIASLLQVVHFAEKWCT